MCESSHLPNVAHVLPRVDNAAKGDDRSAGRPASESLGGGTGERVGRGGRGRRPREGNDERVDEFNGQGNDQGMGANGGVEGVNGNVERANGGAPDFSSIITQQLQNLLPAMLAQVSNRGNVGNQNGNVVNENVQENVGNVLVNGNRMRKMELCMDMSVCSIDKKWNINCLVHLWVRSLRGGNLSDMHASQGRWEYVYGCLHKSTGWWQQQSQKVYAKGRCRSLVALTDEAVRNGSIKKVKKRGNVGETSKDKNGRDDNKRTRNRNVFATTVNPVRRENTGTWPNCTTCNSYHALGGPCRTCFNCNHPGHLAKDCRGAPRNVNPVNARNPTVRACYECGSTDHVRSACLILNRAQEPEGNRPNQVAANKGGQGRGNRGNQARGRVFMLGVEEDRQDSNIVTGTFTLNDHFTTTLFDSGADYSFVPTTFIPLLGLEPIDLGFRYEIEIASGQLVETDKVFKGCKLEIEGHVFDIDLVPFGHGSFDMIIDMDWLSNYKAKIICHEKVVRIPLPDGKALRANVVADALSRKERLKPNRVRAMNMILQSSIKDRILTAQKEAVDEFAVLQKGLYEMIEQRSEGNFDIADLMRRLKVTHDRQKSHADKRRKPLEFSVGDYVLLKVSPWKCVVRFGKKGKLAPRFVGPFEIIDKMFADPTLQVPLDEIRVDAKLNFVEELVEILEREFKKLKRSRIAIVNVRWNLKVS
ncbi:putative reverse transcriptase domain-containing protein [Tanacetum coccineum]